MSIKPVRDAVLSIQPAHEITRHAFSPLLTLTSQSDDDDMLDVHCRRGPLKDQPHHGTPVCRNRCADDDYYDVYYVPIPFSYLFLRQTCGEIVPATASSSSIERIGTRENDDAGQALLGAADGARGAACRRAGILRLKVNSLGFLLLARSEGWPAIMCARCG